MSVLTKIIEVVMDAQEFPLVLRDMAVALKNKGFFNNPDWREELTKHFKDVVDDNISCVTELTDNEYSVSTSANSCETNENVALEWPLPELIVDMSPTPKKRTRPDLPRRRARFVTKAQELLEPKKVKIVENNRSVIYSPKPVDITVSSDPSDNFADKIPDKSVKQSSGAVLSRGRKRKATKGLSLSDDSAADSPINSKRPSLNRSLRNQGYRVKFTMIDPDLHSETLKKLNIFIAETGKYDVLITDGIYRTTKFLCALAAGKPIVSIEWLNAMRTTKSMIDPLKFVLKDAVGEEKYQFNLAETLGAVKKNGVLCSNHSILVTPNTSPPPDILKDIIVASGGKYLKTSLAARKNDEVLCISDPKDTKLVTQLKNKYPSLCEITVEQFMNAIFQYKL